ncbi:acyl-CoA thioesterase domain-containing protein [Microbacterium profundi]|uniref:Acyl-CoA thioesterase domain-containing protein n=1 Tax=Microbacterium profundi TaxID=450380 RepID=A0ABV3LD57_9MICO
MNDIASVLGILDLEKLNENRFRGPSLRHHAAAARLYGGHLLAQALFAAGRTVSSGFLPHSMHAYFLRAGNFDSPIIYEVEHRSEGRAFAARQVIAWQGDELLLEMLVSFSVRLDEAPFQRDTPTPTRPDELRSLQEVLTPYAEELDGWWVRERPFEMRYATTPPRLAVDTPVDTADRTPEVWLRAAGTVPDDALIHCCLLAYASDSSILDAILLRYPDALTRGSAGVTSLDHSIWFHQRPDVSEWLLYTPSTPGGTSRRGMAIGHFYGESGLIATVAQEGLLRRT